MMTELKGSSPMSGGLSPPNCISEPEEKEISDDDDDDRNHKHRRRETRSQSLEGDSLEQGSTQSYRKRNRPFENVQSGLNSDYNSDGGFSKFEKRRNLRANFSRFSGRGRGSRDYQHDSVMPLSHPGHMPSSMFSGRGLSGVSNVPTAPWNNFGPVPAIPNGMIDAINPLAMPILRSQLNPPFNMGVQCQQCPDFEERGFCLRGDMCPMEHGVNRIVVEDVQSLSQFNLPVSLPSAHLMATSTGSGFVPSVSFSGRPSISTVNDDALNLDGTFSGAGNACVADVYDPDQPLWNNDGHDASAQLFGLQFDESEAVLNSELSVHVSQSKNSSVWGRLKSSKSILELKGKQESKLKEIRETSGGTQLTGKQNSSSTLGPKTNDVGPNAKKSAKAHSTLFVNCIPLKDNKRENLLSHFKKFGEVIDIYIPANSERAFVQFSKREEAERALKAPDAVMGSRFIKLWWANRDNIPDEGVSSGNNVSVTHSITPVGSGPLLSGDAHKRKDNVQCVLSRVATSNVPDSLVNVGNESKPVIVNGSKGPPVHRKMESLEHLKEELRKKQEMLEQKRNEFRRQLDKLAKQGTGAKHEASEGQPTKKQKAEPSMDSDKKADGKSADAVVSGSSAQVEKFANQASCLESFPSQLKSKSAPALLGPQGLKQAVHPVMSGVSSPKSRYKLDNRPTEFKICAPLPAGLANVAALREHFKLYGDVSNVEIEESNEEDSPNNASDSSEAARECSARVRFTTRHAAERAFLNGKSWQSHNLHFTWIAPNVPCSSRSSGESSSAHKGVVNPEVQSEEKMAQSDSLDVIDPNSSKIADKSLDEPSSGDSLRSNERKSPVATEENSTFEGQPPNYIPIETNDVENQEGDEAPEETDGDGVRPEEGREMEVSDTILAGGEE